MQVEKPNPQHSLRMLAASWFGCRIGSKEASSLRAAFHRAAIKLLHSAAKTDAAASRLNLTEAICEHEEALKLLNDRRRQYDSIQGNRRIPATIRDDYDGAELWVERDASDPVLVALRNGELANLRRRISCVLTRPKPFATKNPLFRVGRRYSRKLITKAYDDRIWDVLAKSFTIIPDGVGPYAKLITNLPIKEEYLEIAKQHFTWPLADLVLVAYASIAKALYELHATIDDAIENDSEDDLGVESDLADALLDVVHEVPYVPECVAKLQIAYRHKRFASVHDSLTVAQAILRLILEDAEQVAAKSDSERAGAAELQTFCGTLHSHIHQLESL